MKEESGEKLDSTERECLKKRAFLYYNNPKFWTQLYGTGAAWEWYDLDQPAYVRKLGSESFPVYLFGVHIDG